MKKYAFLVFGALFGFILSRAGATTYDFYAKLFLFENLQLLWVIATAAAVGAVGVTILKALKARSWFESRPIAFQGKPYKASLLPGSILFGMGWGLAGACPAPRSRCWAKANSARCSRSPASFWELICTDCNKRAEHCCGGVTP